MSWNQALDIIKENRRENAWQAGQPPIACPIDGEILDVHPDGRRNCPLGNFRWDGGAVVIQPT